MKIEVKIIYESELELGNIDNIMTAIRLGLPVNAEVLLESIEWDNNNNNSENSQDIC